MTPPTPPRSTSRKPVGERKEHRAQGLPKGWHGLCVLMPASMLATLDADLTRLRSAGLTGMSRSRLIRIALRLVDRDALMAAAREEAHTGLGRGRRRSRTPEEAT